MVFRRIVIYLLLFVTVTVATGADGARRLPDSVSIGLVSAQPDLTLRLPAGVTVHRSSIVLQQIAADATLTCSIGTDGGIMVGGINYGKEPLRFTNGGGPIGWGTRQYRGTLVVSVASRGLILVNEVDLEDYLRGVVPAEVNPTWQIEALKAQAIAARTFTVGRIGHHRKDGYDLCATVDCQVYVGAGGEKPSTDLAVAETAGRVLTYNGRLANTFYHSASGGHTENVESVWTGASPQIYLRGVPDPAESSPYDRWHVELDWAGAEAAVALKYPEIGRLRAIEIMGRTAAGRILLAELVGERARVRTNGEALRTIFSLRSSLCDIEVVFEPVPNPRWEEVADAPVAHAVVPSAVSLWSGIEGAPWNLVPVKLCFDGRGWGHGVGMSQYGAKALADLGYTYAMILKYYYQGTEVEDWRPPQDLPSVSGNGEVAG